MEGGVGPGGYGYSYPPGGSPFGYPPPPRGPFQRGWFWITLATIVVVTAGVICAIVLTSGGGSQPVAEQPTGAGRPRGTTTSASTPVSTPTPTGSDLGRTLRVAGQTPGEKLAITLVAVDESARTSNEYDKPPKGGHYVAVEFRIHNIGSTTYSDAIGNCDKVFDADDSVYDNTVVQPISSGPVLVTVKVAPGRSQHGWSVFTLPIGTTIASVTYTPDSGFAEHTVRWKLR